MVSVSLCRSFFLLRGRQTSYLSVRHSTCFFFLLIPTRLPALLEPRGHLLFPLPYLLYRLHSPPITPPPPRTVAACPSLASKLSETVGKTGREWMDRMLVIVDIDLLLVEAHSTAVLVLARGRADGFHSVSVHSVARSVDWSVSSAPLGQH